MVGIGTVFDGYPDNRNSPDLLGYSPGNSDPQPGVVAGETDISARGETIAETRME